VTIYRFRVLNSAIAILLFFLVTAMAGAQILPAMIYGDSMPERATALVEGVDPGYCMAGWTKSYGVGTPGFSNILVIKTDPLGVPLWSRVSLGDKDDEAYSMVRTSDQCYTITGWTKSYGIGIPNKNIFVLKLDASGNPVWGWVYGGELDDEAYSIIETIDNGYAVTGFTHSFGPPPYPNILVMKLGPQGMLQWAKVYWVFPDHNQDEGYAIIQTPDTGYAVVGRTKISGSTFFDPFVLKIDQLGNTQWVKIMLGEIDKDEGYSVALDLQSNILAAGFTRSWGTNPGNAADMFVAQFGMNGVPFWSRTYGWTEGDEMVLDDRSLTATSDGGSAVCGPTTSRGPGIPNPNFLILKLDPAGMPMWGRSHPSPYDPGLLSDVPLPMIQEQNGGYAIAGWTNSFPYLGGTDDFHLLTLDQNGDRPVCVEPQDPEMQETNWEPCEMVDTAFSVVIDSLKLEPVEVSYHPICQESTAVHEKTRVLPKVQSLQMQVTGDRIELNLSHAAFVTVKLFARDGRQVALLASKQFDAGKHELMLPADIASGVYLVRASANRVNVRAKVVRF